MNRRKLLVLLDTRFHYDRTVLNGIHSKIKSLKLDIDIFVDSAMNDSYIRSRQWDYIIADYDKTENRPLLEKIKGRTLVINSYEHPPYPSHLNVVSIDNHSLIDIALSYFMSAHINSIGFFADACDSNSQWAYEREVVFKQLATKHNLQLINNVEEILDDISLPIGILCASDRSARKMAALCYEKHLRIPDQVFLIGIDSDDAESNLSSIPFYSINLDAYKLGQRSLDLLLASKLNLTSKHHYFDDFQLVSPNKTQTVTLHNDIVSKAITFLHKNYHHNIKINHVVEHCDVSRKTLDNHFQASYNCTTHQYLAELRIKKAKHLLLTTQDSIESIALQCGYPGQSYLYQVFRKYCKQTPWQYRQSQN